MHSNTEIFDFKFVDREKEKEKIDEYWESPNNFLWLDGVHGVGKSFFIENYIIPIAKKKFEFVVYVNKSSNEKNINYLSILLETFTKELPVPFEKYIYEHYCKWTNTIEHISKNLDEFKSTKLISSFTNILLNVNGLFINKKKEEHTTAKAIFEYIEEIILNSNACIILDNFTYCDQESFRILEEMFVRIVGNESLRFLICTTTEEREHCKDINILLCDKLPHIYVPMEKFDDAKYFQQIMINKFHMNRWLIEHIEDIYNLCDGIPDNLRNFIRQLYIENGIKLQEDKFLIAQEKIVQLIYKKSIDFDPSMLHPNEKLLIQIIALFGMPMPFDLLVDFIIYINQETSVHSFQFKLIGEKIQEIVENLLECKIIIMQFCNGIEKITFMHDNIFNVLYNYYHEEKNASSVGYLHHLIYLYLVNRKELLKQYDFAEESILEALAIQSYDANEDDWQKYNRELAIYYYRSNKFYRCNEILSRFRKKCRYLNKEIILMMADVFYEIAEYQSCIQELDTLSLSELNILEKAKYHVLYGKAISFSDSKKAANNFEAALDLELPFELKCQVEYYCEMSYAEIKDKFEAAQDVFFKFYNNVDYKNSAVYASVLRSAVNLFSIEEATSYLNQGLNIAKIRADTLEEAKIINNLGFLYTRQEDYESANKCFESSCIKLESVKPFEMSYPLTNMAFVQMVFKKWEIALEYIETAIMYNKTDFLSYVLKTYKMICFIQTKKVDKALEIQAQLLEDIRTEKIIDYKMVKKSKINCALVAYKIGDIATKENLLQDCWSIVENSNAQNRFLNLCKKMDYQPQTYNIDVIPSTYDLYSSIDFEPWVVTFGHD